MVNAPSRARGLSVCPQQLLQEPPLQAQGPDAQYTKQVTRRSGHLTLYLIHRLGGGGRLLRCAGLGLGGGGCCKEP